MAEHRKTARARKVATRKTVRKNTGKTTARKASSARRKSAAPKASPKRWSQRVTRESDALDLKHGVFKLTNPKKIAASLKRSAERSSRRKAGAYRSALSMLTFRQDVAENATRPAAARQDRAEAPVWKGLMTALVFGTAVIPAESGYPVIAGLHESRTVTEYWIIRFRG